MRSSSLKQREIDAQLLWMPGPARQRSARLERTGAFSMGAAFGKHKTMSCQRKSSTKMMDHPVNEPHRATGRGFHHFGLGFHRAFKKDAVLAAMSSMEGVSVPPTAFQLWPEFWTIRISTGAFTASARAFM